MIFRILNRAEEGIIALLLVGMTLLTFGDVIARFVFDTGALWTEELTLTISAWLVLFGASWGLKAGAHIGVQAFVRLFPPRVQRVLGVLAVVCCLCYCGLLIYGAWIYVAKLYSIGIEMEDLPVPRWAVQSILIFGLALLALRFAQLGWRIFRGAESGFDQVDEAEGVLGEVGTYPGQEVDRGR